MECLDDETVLAWVDGRIGGPRAHDVETHIDACPACRRLVSEAAAAAAAERPLDEAGIGPAVRDPARPRPGAAGAPKADPRAARRRWGWIAGALAAAAALGAGAAALAIGARGGSSGPRTSAPTVAPVLDRPGQVLAARWAPGGLLVNATFGGGLPEAEPGALRLVRRGGDGALVPVPAADGAWLVGARDDRLLVLRELAPHDGGLRGRLAILDRAGKLAPVSGDVGDLVGADFLPDGVAVARSRRQRLEIEAPLGTVVYAARAALRGLRTSPRGRIAFVEVPAGDAEPARVQVIEPGGRAVHVEGDWREASSVAWSGEDLLVGGSREGGGHAVWRLPDGGRGDRRLIWSAARGIVVHDASPAGALLVSEVDATRRLFLRRAEDPADRDVSWTERPVLADLSRDGAWLAFLEPSDRRGEPPAIYVRRAEGGEPILAGRGDGGALDPDGGRVLVWTERPPGLVETRLSPGRDRHRPMSRTLARGGRGERDVIDAAGWLDADRVAFVVRAPEGLALHVQPVDGEPVHRGAWPGQLPRTRFQISPDGAHLGAVDHHGEPALIDAATLAVTPLVELEGHAIVGWSAAGDAVFVARHDRWPVAVSRHAVATGARARLLEIAAPVPGARPPDRLRVAGDGKTYAYSAQVIETRLVRVDGALEAGGR